MKNVRIISDSSANIYTLKNVSFKSAPLKIIVGRNEYIDTEELDTSALVEAFRKTQEASTTSCPNVYDWREAFKGSDNIFVVTISGAVSGCNSTAHLAKNEYLKEYPDANICVIDSLSTGPEMVLIIEKLAEYIERGMEFSEIRDSIENYMKKTHLLFFLKSMDNLVKNGRISAAAAKISSLLDIHLLGRASSLGTLEPLKKCRGEKNSINSVIKSMKEMKFSGGKVIISHCHNFEAALALRDKILNEFSKAIIKIQKCGGLCSFYAQEGGLLVGFEA